MVQNETGITSLDSFDSTIPDSARQYIDVTTNYGSIDSKATFVGKLVERGVIKEHENHKSRRIDLCVDGVDESPHNVVNYDYPIASASYIYHPVAEVAQVGSVSVRYQLRGRGIGTQMKKQLNNHMMQDGATKAYTWLASEAGKNLAIKTGYKPEKEVFPDVDEIWFRRFDR